MKKILCIAPYRYLPPQAGGQKYIADFLRHLSARANLTVISTGNNIPGAKDHYTLLPYLADESWRYADPGLILQLHRLIKKHRYDAIIWEHPYYGWLAAILKWLKGIHTVYHTHNIEYQRFKSIGKWWWPLLRVYEKWALQRAEQVYCITEEDREVVLKEFKIAPEKITLVTVGVDSTGDVEEKSRYKHVVCQRHGLAENTRLYLFAGLLNYKPNENAVLFIKNQLNPLLKAADQPSAIIICGKGLDAAIAETGKLTDNILYTGFVEDLCEYLSAADIFLNPVTDGGGIKTKVIEALAHHTTVISTRSGATGINREVGGDKLVIIPDNDTQAFAVAAVSVMANRPTPESFFNYYNWEKITVNVLEKLPG